MMKGKASRSTLTCDGLGKNYFFNIGRGVLSLLAVMLLTTAQLAFANGPTVTVDPTSLDIDETDAVATGTYTIRLDASPEEDVMVTVVGAPEDSARVDEDVAVSSTGVTATNGLLVITFEADATGADLAAEVTVNVHPDDDGVSERVTLTHTAAVGTRDAVTLANASVDVRVNDDETQQCERITRRTVDVTEA